MVYLATLDGPAALPVLTSSLAMEGRRPDALFALGFTGLRDAVEACVPYLDDAEPPIAKLAGEAVAAITGVRSTPRSSARPPRPSHRAAAQAG